MLEQQVVLLLVTLAVLPAQHQKILQSKYCTLKKRVFSIVSPQGFPDVVVKEALISALSVKFIIKCDI